jgi:hypothetical protein
MFRPDDPVHAAAKQQCKMGDESALSLVQELIAKGLPASHLKGCLDNATRAGCIPLIKGLLALGVPITFWIAVTAMKTNEPEILLKILPLFVAHGWMSTNKRRLKFPDIYCELTYALSKCLSYAHMYCYSLALQQPTPDESVVTWFLDNGANPDQGCTIGMTPLSIGLQNASLAIIKLLYERCSAPKHGHLLHHAACRSKEDCVAVLQLVLDHFHPDINGIQFANHAFPFAVYKALGLGTALHEAARAGRP